MAGSGFGTNFRITTWGETHGAGQGGRAEQRSCLFQFHL